MRMDNPKFIKKEQLDGYREPNPAEKRAVWLFTKDNILMRCKRICIIQAVCWGITGLLVIYFMLSYISGSATKGSVGYMIVATVSALICSMLATAQREQLYMLRHNLYHGVFLVLDVISDRIEAADSFWGHGTVRISDENGHHCYDKFPIDLDFAEENRGPKHIPMLLVHESQHGYYQILVKDTIRAEVEWDFEPI